MTDRNIDFELIMALAEESLPPAEAAAAEAALDEASRTELAAQRQALAALAGLAPAAMTVSERTNLREVVRSELHVSRAVELPVDTTRAKTPWYVKALPALGAAAALVLVVGIGLSSIGGLGGGSDDSAIQATTATEATAATTAATEAATAARSLLGDAESAPQSALDMADTTEATSVATAAAAAETEATADDGGFARMTLPDDLGAVSLSDLDEIDALTEEAAEALITNFPFTAFYLPDAAGEPGLTCWASVLDSIGLEGEILYMGTATIDGVAGEIYRTVSTDNELTIHVFTGPACDPVALIFP